MTLATCTSKKNTNFIWRLRILCAIITSLRSCGEPCLGTLFPLWWESRSTVCLPVFLLFTYTYVYNTYSGSYNEVTPPHSVINIKDFETPKDLANYITYLNNNDEEYISYFWWQRHYKVMVGGHKPYYWAPELPAVCDMCRRLHDPQEPSSQIQNFENLMTCRDVDRHYWRKKARLAEKHKTKNK